MSREKNQGTAALEKRALMDQRRIIKPGECMKYITACIDPGCLKTDLMGTEIVDKLKSASVKVLSEPQVVSNSILWRRQLPQTLTTSKNQQLTMTDSTQTENHVLWLLSGEDLVYYVNEKRLLKKVERLTAKVSPATLYMLVCGLKTYCKNNRGCVTRTATEFALTEVQLIHNCCYRFLETAEEVANTVLQFTKSVAEEPFKKEKMDKYEKENYYLGNDSKDCVKVSNGNGLARLWQQQLMKLPMVTLEVAEAITSVYPMPSLLISALINFDNPQELLIDLPIRRAGLLSNTRRIGPEISRKVWNLMMNRDPDAVI